MVINKTKEWYEKSYKEKGLGAQRRYPNEELLRFFGRYYFESFTRKERSGVKVLEVGCGSCSNLWMIAKEGFNTYGLDLSNESLALGQVMLANWQCKAQLKQGNFLELPYPNSYFDVIIDVFSMNCVGHSDFLQALSEVYRVLKTNGLFFSYTPGQNSTAFKNYAPAEKIDSYTLSGIYRRDSPFAGNHYLFHFWKKEQYQKTLVKKGFGIEYMESVKKSYFSSKEIFEHISVYARK